MAENFDLVVIGGGPGGYVCAIRAAQLGQKVAVVERENLGGICLNWGCIPTKALLKAAEIYTSIQHAAAFGIKVKGTDVNVKKLIQRSRDVSSQLNMGVGFLMKKNGITVFEGEGSFKDKSHLVVKKGKKTAHTLKFKNAVIATGARAKEIPGVLEADHKNIWTYRDAMVPEKLPKSLLVIGAGAIGIEFASFYNALGCHVQIVEGVDRILPIEDKEISKRAQKSLEKQGMEINTSAKVLGLKSGRSVEAELEINGKKQKKKYDKALLSIGIQANIEGVGLDKIDVRTDKGFVKVDEYYQTNVPGIYAIGDVIATPALAHVASHEGVIAAEYIAGGHPHAMNYDHIPGCTYCTPQVASIGLTEEAAKERGIDLKIGRYDYKANGKALAIGENEGLVKTLFDKNTGALVGAHIVGAEATEMISSFIVALQVESTEEDLIHACLPHPTLSEMIGESVLDSEGRVINA